MFNDKIQEVERKGGVQYYSHSRFNITHIIRTSASFFNIPKFVISAPKSSFELSD